MCLPVPLKEVASIPRQRPRKIEDCKDHQSQGRPTHCLSHVGTKAHTYAGNTIATLLEEADGPRYQETRLALDAALSSASHLAFRLQRGKAMREERNPKTNISCVDHVIMCVCARICACVLFQNL